MNFRNYIFILLLLCFGCKNTVETHTPKTTVLSIEKTINFSFVDSVQIVKTDHPFRAFQYRSNGRLISKEEFQELQLEQVFITYSPTLEYRLLANFHA